jgi:hypothetical protein
VLTRQLFDAAVPVGVLALMLPVACGGALVPLAGCGDDDPSGPPAGEPAAQAGDRPARPLSPTAAKAAVKAGRRACRDRRPGQVAESNLARARRRAGHDGPELLRLVAERRGELRGRELSDIAARVYALSLPPAASQAGYRGCRAELRSGGRS